MRELHEQEAVGQRNPTFEARWQRVVAIVRLSSLRRGVFGFFNHQLAEWIGPYISRHFYRFTHYWFAAADIPVANDIPVHCADAIRCNVRRPPQGSLPLLTRQVLA